MGGAAAGHGCSAGSHVVLSLFAHHVCDVEHMLGSLWCCCAVRAWPFCRCGQSSKCS